MSSSRIALAGLACECCTFSPLRTQAADFCIVQGADAAACQAGQDFAAGLAGSRIVGGWLGRALPGGPVSAEAYAGLRAQLVAGLQACSPIDGIALDLHGAMAAEGIDDAECDLLDAIRAACGPDLPIVAAMDLHGNVSQQLVDQLDALTAYRTAPHVDVAQTRARAAELLEQILAGERPHAARIAIPALLTGEQTSTEFEPGKSVWEQVEQACSSAGVRDASLFAGYAWSDEPRTGASAICYADDAPTAQAAAERIAAAYWDRRKDFVCPVPVLAPAAALEWAQAQPAQPAVVSDAADNPTAGGAGDAAAMLAEALRLDLPSCLIAGLADEPATLEALAAGVGAQLDLTLGATLAPDLSKPCSGSFEVLAVRADDGEGACATLRCGGVTAIVTQRRRTFHRMCDFAHADVDPQQFAVVVLKLGYLEPEIKALAHTHCMASGPGCVPPDISALHYRRAQRKYP